MRRNSEGLTPRVSFPSSISPVAQGALYSLLTMQGEIPILCCWDGVSFCYKVREILPHLLELFVSFLVLLA